MERPPMATRLVETPSRSASSAVALLTVWHEHLRWIGSAFPR